MLRLMRLPGTDIFSAHPRTFSRAKGVDLDFGAGAGVILDEAGALAILDRSHEGSKAETRCMADSTGRAAVLLHHAIWQQSR